MHRLTPLAVAVAVVVLAGAMITSIPAPAEASETYEMYFPIAGTYRYSDTWGAPRSGGRSHTGTDIIADKMEVVVAVASGTIGWMHDELGGKCCAMALQHDDGWQSWYIHLNNDTPGTDDGQGWGFAPGIAPGVHVEAGQFIGWVGDSGNAEHTISHVHFELHQPDGQKVNPYPHLIAATELDEPIDPDFEMEIVSTTTDQLVAYDPDSGSLFDLGGHDMTGEMMPNANVIWSGYLGENDGTDILGYDAVTSRFNFLSLADNRWESFFDATGTAGWTNVVPGDFDGDGVTDLLFYRATDGLMRFYTIRDGTFAPLTDVMWGSVGWTQIVPGDFDNDGSDDLLWYRASDGVMRFYEVTTEGTFSPLTEVMTGTSGWDHIPSGDFDGDGSDDLLYYRSSDGLSRMYTVTEGSVFTALGQAFELPAGLSGVIVGDFTDELGDEVATYRDQSITIRNFEASSLPSTGTYAVGRGLLLTTVRP